MRSLFRDWHGGFGYIRLKLHRCASGPSRFGFRQVRRGPICIGIHRHLTIRSSRPHVVASAVCFTLRLHTSAAPPRGGLTQALGGEKHLVVVLLAVAVNRLRSALLFGYVLGAFPLRLHRFARSYFACVTFAGFGCNRSLSFHVAAPEPVTSDRSSGKVARRAHECGLRFSASSPGLHPRWLPSRLTIRSSRPRVVASATCFALRLHVSTAPPQGGLTPALGGRKAFCKCAAHRLDLQASVGSARRTGHRRVAASFKSAGRAHPSHVRRVYLLRKQCSSAARSLTPCPLLRRRPAESSRGALMLSCFGVRQVRLGFTQSASHPPNNSFKPTPFRGVSRVPTLR